MSETNTTNEGTDANEATDAPVIHEARIWPQIWHRLDEDTSALEIPGKGVVLRCDCEGMVHLPFVHLNGYRADGSLISEHAPESEKEKAVSWKLS